MPLSFRRTSRKDKKKRWSETLRGADRDAVVALQRLFRSYGLAELSDDIVNFIQQGYSADTVALMLQDTASYKKRFAGNDARRRAGLPVLSPAEYLSVESSYRQVMESAGLPPKFYDSPKDFAKWIGDDVSPTEIKSRVDSAVKLVDAVDPEIRREFRRWYSDGEMYAYALDRKRTAEILDRQVRAAEVGMNLRRSGVDVGRLTAERIGALGIEGGAQQQGAAQAAQYEQGFGMLGSLAGVEYGDEAAAQDVFLNDEEAGKVRRGLASQERGRFAGSSGANETTLSRARAGNV